MSAASVQLPLETVLRDFITAQPGIFPAGFTIVRGHGAETVNENASDYLSIICSLPRAITPGYPEAAVRLELVTSVSEPGTRAAQIAAHAARLASLLDLFHFDERAVSEAAFAATLAALNALAAPQHFGITGWEADPAPDEDGVTPANQLVAKPSLLFDLFLTA